MDGGAAGLGACGETIGLPWGGGLVGVAVAMATLSRVSWELGGGWCRVTLLRGGEPLAVTMKTMRQ